VESLLQSRGDSYEPSVAKRASVAAAPLAEWVKANVAFSRVLHKIRPLEEEQNRLESGLRSAQSRMNSLSNQLEGVETEVGALRNRLNQVTVEAAQIEVSLKQTNFILSQSEKLIGDLSGEFSRWKQQLSEINTTLKSLPMSSLITSAYIVYCSSESSMEKRKQLLQKCCQVVNIAEFDVTAFLNCSSEEDIFLNIKSYHLTPLICDPARKVINKFESCEITDMRNRDWVKVMELSLRFGRTLIINDFNRLDFALLPILRNEIYGSIDARNWIYIGDKRLDYNRNFKLYFVTQDVNSDIFHNPLFNLINLSPSGSGMSSTLLSLIIQCRRPELETKKTELEKTKQALELKLRDLESQLLNKLTESTGNILNNTELVRSLNELKKSALQVEHSLEESAKLSDDLNRERAEYESLSTFASQIYFLIRELVNLNPMYRIGVDEYEYVFNESLNTSKELTPSQLLQVSQCFIFD
jgi:dynein heavy chain 2